MQIKGRIIKVMPVTSGVSKAGNEWVKAEYILETHSEFPKKVHFDIFGEKAKTYVLKEGDNVTISADIESREYNGKWYTSVHAWKAEMIGEEITSNHPVDTAQSYGDAKLAELNSKAEWKKAAEMIDAVMGSDDIPF